MGQVMRILVKAALGLSVFLLVGWVILWVRSYFVGNLIRHMGEDVIPNTSYFISSAEGTLVLSRYEQTSRDLASGGVRYPAGFSRERWDSGYNPLLWESGTTVNTFGF